LGINQSATHDAGDAVDQGVLNTAGGNVYHVVAAEFEQSQLGRAQPTPNGQPRAVSESGRVPGNRRNFRQPVSSRQLIEYDARVRSYAPLRKSGAAGARRTVRARRQTGGVRQIWIYDICH
jgi:hypothetical protein